MSLSHVNNSSSSSCCSGINPSSPGKLKSEKHHQSHNPRLLLLWLKNNSSYSKFPPLRPHPPPRRHLRPRHRRGRLRWHPPLRRPQAPRRRRPRPRLLLRPHPQALPPVPPRPHRRLRRPGGGYINDSPLLRKLLDVVPFTHVAHLAAQDGVRHATKNPSSYVRGNVAGLVSLLEAARSADPQPAIVWASSSSVYGLNAELPFSESHRTDRPASLYAATKKAGEEIAHAYNHIHGLSITALRFFTVYGPWGRPDMAYYSFTKDILRGKPITIFQGPDPSATAAVARDFTYIDDIVQGCFAALDTAERSTGGRHARREARPRAAEGVQPRQHLPRARGRARLHPREAELVSILERLLKVKANKKYVEMPANGDVQFTHANISLAQRELGYHPTTDLKTGLKKFGKWCLDYYNPITYKNSHRSSRS